jgi:GT2 family glycosyltransferase
MYTEEVDWCYRMRNAGWDAYVVPSARIVHVDGGSSGPIASDKLLWLSRGRLRFLSAIRPPWMIRLTHIGLRLIGAAKTLAWLAIGFAFASTSERARLKARANWRLATWRTLA